MSPQPDSSISNVDLGTVATTIQARTKTLAELPNNSIGPIFELLVAMSGTIKADDYSRLGPVVWNEGLDSGDPFIIMNVSHLYSLSSWGLHQTPGLFSLYAMRRKSIEDIPRNGFVIHAKVHQVLHYTTRLLKVCFLFILVPLPVLGVRQCKNLVFC